MGRDKLGPSRTGGIVIRLIFLTLLAFWLRVYEIEAFGFWIDEALTPLRAAYPLPDLLRGVVYIQEATSQDTHPPLYYLLIHFTQLVTGRSDLALRLPSALLGALLVPIVFQLGRRLFNPRSGLLAALLVAVNPLQIWYGQEARMYPLLMVNVAAALFFFWPLVKNRRWRHPTLIGYLTFAALSLATHYSAVFWLAGHALLWGWIIWPSPWGRRIIAAGLLLAAAGLLSTPWTLPRLYWGAETGYTYLPPWVMLSDLFTGFGLGVTPPKPDWLATLLWAGAIVSTLASLWLLSRQKSWPWPAFLAINLLSILIGLAVISPLKPLYQGIRHIMIAFPAWIVLLAYGIDRGLALLRRPDRAADRLLTLGAALALPVLLVGAAGSYWRLRTDPTVAKDNFREAVAYVEQQAGRRDLVLYNDAIAMLIHDHYRSRPDLQVTALPTYPHAATDGIDQTLAQLVQGVDRVWFFPGLPTDGRDSDRRVRAWLEANLPQLSARPFFSRGTILQVILYDSRPVDAQPLNPVDPPLAAEGWPSLKGVSVLEKNPQQLWVELFWDEFSFSPAQEVKLNLVDQAGREWAATQRPVLPGGRPTRGDQPRRMFQLPLPTGLPPGPYRLQGQLIANQHTPVSEVRILTEIAYPGVPSTAPAAAAFGDLELVDIEIIADEIRPGYAISLTPIWRTPAADFRPQAMAVKLTVRDPAGQVLSETANSPGPDWLVSWPANALVRDPIGFQIPAAGQDGTYTLHWQVTDGAGQIVAARPAGFAGLSRTDELPLGRFEVDPWPFVAQQPAVAHQQSAVWGDFARLSGYNLSMDSQQLNVDLVWEALRPTAENLFVFVHLVDDASGEIAAQQDWFPVGGLRPTNSWRSGEFIVDTHTLGIKDLPAGRYRLIVGLVDPGTFERLPAVAAGVDLPDRQLFLQEITLP